MIFEGLSERLQATFKKLRGHGKLTEADVNEAMRDVRMALLEADVNFKVVKDFVQKVKERAIGQNILETLTPAQAVIKIVDEELTALMGGTQSRLNISSAPPTVIMMVGLQGAGKTTTAGKLAPASGSRRHLSPGGGKTASGIGRTARCSGIFYAAGDGRGGDRYGGASLCRRARG